MARLKIDYGIDLGTTNSAICRMEKGEPVIIKTDVLKDTMPSCVSFTRRQSVKAGDSAFNDLKSDKSNVVIKGDSKIDTGLRKMGAILGDNSEIGCNSVLCPGSIIGKNSSVYPLVMVRGVIPENSIVKSINNIVRKKENNG